ncbi:MAG TPA: valine--tRNA ligase [Chitinophagaceae bacterium]
MELTRNFDHRAAEQKWYAHWIDNNYFKSEPTTADGQPDPREPFAVVIPPPNVTGVLHMGHCLNNTIQDILVRRARMQGKNACWVPGTDHASIATEAKVVQMLREKGISKSSLSRDEFLKHAWEWKDQYGGIILKQLRKLGCSADWDRTTFTMDPHYYQSVIGVFVDLFRKGYIYRGKRMINWDPRARTALSDEEVIRKEVQSRLYFIKYRLEPLGAEGETGSITIATVRPETILGDTAIAVNPKDERYLHLHGRFAFVPLINRRIPIIADEYVETDFGTGALKITPAHDKNDFLIGEKHGLEVIDTLNEDGTLNEAAQLFVGQDRFEARKNIVSELEAQGYLLKTENYVNQVGFSERTDVVVEDRLSLQWWVDMKKIYKPALDAVTKDDIRFHPARFKNLYRNWMENIRDWCISRQLWWGQRIPAWYDGDGNVYVAHNLDEAISLASAKSGKRVSAQLLYQDEDVLDTWFSSWLWPIEVFKGYSNPGNPDISYYYPTDTLVTAPEIIFFWVARMIMAGYEYQHEKPFSDVYYTGIVRDELGRKMSKQLGNSPDLLGLIDKYGADAVRFGIIISSPAGNDLLFDVKEESTLRQGSFFINKMWNALKLVKMWEQRQGDDDVGEKKSFAVAWFRSRLDEARASFEDLYADFRLSEILKLIYSLIWDDFCSWYLEWIKPGMQEPIDSFTYEATVRFFEELVQMLHPFMPFATEEIYHQLRQRPAGDDLTISRYPAAGVPNKQILQQGDRLKEVVTAIRDARNKAQLRPKDMVSISVETDDAESIQPLVDILQKQVNADRISFVITPVAKAITVVVGTDKYYLTGESTEATGNQREQLEKDLEYLEGFLRSVEKKLSNEKFVANAKPDVVDSERKKKTDAEEKIRAIRDSLTSLS